VYKIFLRPFFFLFPAEQAHHFAINLLEWTIRIPGGEWLLKKLFSLESTSHYKEVCGLNFKNAVGLAAGFDKDAKHIHALSLLGFGFIEIGTVTPLPQPGNDPPRLFRLTKDEALINRMGFNNQGVDLVVARLKNTPKKDVLIGGNIGVNKNTPIENAIADYETCFLKLFLHVDYFVVNVSSPNTPDLRSLHDKEPLSKLLSRLQELNHQYDVPKPIFVKIAPDLTNSQLDDIIDIIITTEVAGIVATNTSVSRRGLTTPLHLIEQLGAGGLSGKPVAKRATEVIEYIQSKAEGRFVIIGVGGIHTPEDAVEKLKSGADLVQVYTGLIYEGPGLVRRINKLKIQQNS
jgi:dihydroorotate dehydrogenase